MSTHQKQDIYVFSILSGGSCPLSAAVFRDLKGEDHLFNSVLPLVSGSLYTAPDGLFLIFLTFEFSFVCCISLSTGLLPSTRATMMAGAYAAAGLGRMTGALTGGPLWLSGGLFPVAGASAFVTVLGMICLIWGLRGWQAQ